MIVLLEGRVHGRSGDPTVGVLPLEGDVGRGHVSAISGVMASSVVEEACAESSSLTLAATAEICPLEASACLPAHARPELPTKDSKGRQGSEGWPTKLPCIPKPRYQEAHMARSRRN
jgi:hypothetical protein|uniref:Uncharacterized protein n=1 Tax=Eutreptiella gymnastica TaxID=73025 RepID=A0A7S4CVA4_9EUGL|mmetsp:Transcript_61164/g.101330  ORF Transcript_61164/g.101330 Transcript_61164/m.101330 type:complete len:117 (-) Transcript_61164:1813-2163(-)